MKKYGFKNTLGQWKLGSTDFLIFFSILAFVMPIIRAFEYYDIPFSPFFLFLFIYLVSKYFNIKKTIRYIENKVDETMLEIIDFNERVKNKNNQVFIPTDFEKKLKRKIVKKGQISVEIRDYYIKRAFFAQLVKRTELSEIFILYKWDKLDKELLFTHQLVSESFLSKNDDLINSCEVESNKLWKIISMHQKLDFDFLLSNMKKIDYESLMANKNLNLEEKETIKDCFTVKSLFYKPVRPAIY